ncbi:MAG: nitrite reductase large subunit [Acidothermus sp.]|nr:nitrite reductase large subunit [Acidothermus sp.]
MKGSNRTTSRRVIVVGNGMVGHRLVEELADSSVDQIIVFSEEPRPAYDRVSLSSYFDGKSAADLSLVPATGYPHAELVLGDPVVGLNLADREILTSTGRVETYDTLVLATGSRPFVPPVDGRDLPGVFTYRTLDDLDAIKEAAEGASCGLVVGGGLLGLEAARALRLLGLAVTVVERSNRLLPLQVDDGGGAVLLRHILPLGIDVRLDSTIVGLEPGHDGRVRHARLADGTEIPADVVVFAAGVRPCDELARTAGLEVGRRGGIVVDETCATSVPGVYAIGECACVGGIDGLVYGLVAPGYEMARVVVTQLRGEDASLGTLDTSTTLKLLGVDVASFGDAFGKSDGALELVYADHVNALYKKLVVSADAKRLLGGILVGDANDYPMLRTLVRSGEELGVDPQQLLSSGTQALPITGKALGEDAIICSCRNVCAGTIRAAVHDGADTVAELRNCTQAGTGCGSCVPMLTAILKEELEKAGRAVSRGLCEHFDVTRQELFEIIAVTGIDTFDELVRRYGRGRGCDICKPVVASILAGRPGSHPLDPQTAALQDTNDHVLANLQKDGTYSVVPRIPGGEITPDGLITLGTIAKEFGLYTKITGGQRIDMFGARIDQLPCIWERLVAAGFESGHAYGKAMRTVKSCVGSTWCRYGVQDSVRLAIDLELRYRGLRAPHKIKAGVSGCARECAEARSKDVGVIATEKGWNLYIGGNGGFSPRHAQLLASDLDEATLVRYIDRFLMYYIRTADRLQRTAAWLENLEGGIEHVRRVIIEDALGLCAELDAAMERHVASYVDEWKATLNDPQKRARFIAFVNDPDRTDPSIVFVPERGQHRPARKGELAAPSLTSAR